MVALPARDICTIKLPRKCAPGSNLTSGFTLSSLHRDGVEVVLPCHLYIVVSCKPNLYSRFQRFAAQNRTVRLYR